MTRRYPVRPPTAMMVLGVLLFGGSTALFVGLGLSDPSGVVIQGVVELGPVGARIVFFVLAALALGMTLLAAASLVVYRKHVPELVIDDTNITVPGPLWRRLAPQTVRFADVATIRLQSTSGEEFMTLVTSERKVWFVKSQLPKGAFDEIVAHVRERVRP